MRRLVGWSITIAGVALGVVSLITDEIALLGVIAFLLIVGGLVLVASGREPEPQRVVRR